MNIDLSTIAAHHQSLIALVAGALVLLMFAPKLDRSTTAVSAIALVATAIAFVASLRGTHEGQYAVSVVSFALLVSMLLLGQAELHQKTQRPEAAALLLIGGIGAIVLVTSKNLLELALGVEMISLVASVLTAMGQGSRPLEAGFKYFVLTAVTFATLLFGAALVFLGTGSLGFPIVAVMGADPAQWLVFGGLALMTVGLGYKLALAPVHFGALDAYTAGPSSFVGFIMVASKMGAVVALARLAASAGGHLDTLLMIIGLGTLFWGVIGSFGQEDLRRLLAYSAIAHAGFLGLAAASGVDGARTGAYYLVGYGAAALLCFAALAGHGTGPLVTRRIGDEKLGGLRALGLLIGLLSLAGIPPLPGFWVKLAVLKAVYVHFGVMPTVLAALGGVVGVIYYLRPVPDLFAEARRAPQGALVGSIAVVIAAAAVVALGLFPALGWVLAP
jgi:NADH-quinone oxidoreductase subunit N